jgi:GNAT superfamily N-acetyltransferase
MLISALCSTDLASLPQIQPADWTDISIPISFYLQTDFCHAFKVEIDGNLVGTGTAILHQNTGWLASIITHSEYRKQGIGKAITEHLLAFLQDKQCNYIYLIATALGEPVYKKVGFTTESRYDYYKDISEGNFEISPYIIAYEPVYKQAVLNMDRHISGEDRLPYLEGFLHDSFIYMVDKIIQGVYFPRLGDGMIIAQTDSAGIELMKKRLQKFNIVSFPQENMAAGKFMLSLGYEPFTTHARMYFKKQMPWNPRGLFNRVGGNIG